MERLGKVKNIYVLLSINLNLKYILNMCFFQMGQTFYFLSRMYQRSMNDTPVFVHCSTTMPPPTTTKTPTKVIPACRLVRRHRKDVYLNLFESKDM